MAKALCPVCGWYCNANGNNDNNIIFTIKDTLCVPVVTLSAREKQKLSMLLSKGFER